MMIDCPLPVIVSVEELRAVGPMLDGNTIIITSAAGVFVATIACRSGPRKEGGRITVQSKEPENVPVPVPKMVPRGH